MKMTPKKRKKLLEYIQSGACPTHMLPIYRWWLQRRPEQTCPEPTPLIWYLLAGRGSGKTWSASNYIYEFSIFLPWVPENDEVYIAMVGATFDDVKHTMVEGKSGLLKVVPEENLINWNRTVGELKFFVKDGDNQRTVIANAYTAERPEKLRGPNTHLAWLDEVAKFKDANTDPTRVGTTWNNMMLGLRLGTKPHVIVTGTPNKTKLVRYLEEHSGTVVTKMTTFDNRKNLPDSYMEELEQLGRGSQAYRQEVLGEILRDNPDALFSQDVIDENRWEELPDDPDQKFFKVLGYDPSASSAAGSDECGIILCGYTPDIKQASGDLGGRPVVIQPIHSYVLKDLSGHYTPSEQVQLVIKTVLREGVNDLVFEQNQGVQFVLNSLEQAIKDNVLEYRLRERSKRAKKTDYGIVKAWEVSGVTLDNDPFKFTIYAVHAVSGKTLRAEMVSTRYFSNQVHHPSVRLPSCEIKTCRGNLEDQMCSWDPQTSKSSPDRLDALVYCLLHIFGGNILTKSQVIIARPKAEITQSTSEHEANRRRKAMVGVYSMDVGTGGELDIADRNMIPYLDRDSGSIPDSEIYSRKM